MKLTKSKLKQIIKEEFEAALKEAKKSDIIHVTLKSAGEKGMSDAAKRVLDDFDAPKHGTVSKKDWDSTPSDQSVKVTYVGGKTKQLNKKYLKLKEVAIVLGDKEDLGKAGPWPVKDVSTPKKAKDEFSKLTKSVQKEEETLDESGYRAYSIPDVPELRNEVWNDLHAAFRAADQYSPPPDVIDNETGEPVPHPGSSYF